MPLNSGTSAEPAFGLVFPSLWIRLQFALQSAPSVGQSFAHLLDEIVGQGVGVADDLFHVLA